MRDGTQANVGPAAGALNVPERLLYACAVVLTVCTLFLIAVGGMVTSKGAGLSVPDWPTSYGYNMFAFPLSRWWGVSGVFWEHSHRLLASGIGLLTIGLAVGVWRVDRRFWLRVLSLAAVGAVILQGVLGGLRVTLLKDEIGIFHACLAQAFLALGAFIALATSGWWRRPASAPGFAYVPALRLLLTAFAVVAGLVYLQLALGAAMRHSHSGLSILDFPTAYGKAWPPTDAASLARINQERDVALHLPATTAAQIVLQMLHRTGALLTAAAVCAAAWLTWTRRDLLPAGLRRFGLAGPALIAAQIALGIYTIWTNKAADVATAHVAVGAVTFVWAATMTAALARWRKLALADVADSRARQPHVAEEAALAV